MLSGDSLEVERPLLQEEDGGAVPTSPLQCYRCGKAEIRLYPTFGHWACGECISNSPKKGTGHSGMIYHPNTNPDNFTITDVSGIKLLLVPKSHPLFVKWYIEHYPKSKGIVGRQLNYIIYSNGEPVGIIGVASPPLLYKPFVEVFSEKIYKDNVLNNNVYRIVVKGNDYNFGTKVLKLLRLRIPVDYKEKYNKDLLGLVTFVEPPRTGAIYKADNWVYIGKTQGVHVTRRGLWIHKTFVRGEQKEMFYRWLKGKANATMPDSRGMPSV